MCVGKEGYIWFIISSLSDGVRIGWIDDYGFLNVCDSRGSHFNPFGSGIYANSIIAQILSGNITVDDL